jgi:acyl-CoA reductase-like NAD-dependent aldehyde dehydrogenase
MSVAKEEIFGPVISIMRTNTVDEALAIENANPYGNAASCLHKMADWQDILLIMQVPE